MKISLSFSPSSSSSPSSFDGSLGSSRSATTGCLSGILRRLLCTGSLPTYPCDQIKEAEFLKLVQPHDSKIEKIEAPATPGIVARLMGLESLPELNWVPTGKTPDTIGRSRSVNSADYWSEFDPMQGRHRRVRTSLSFREPPTFLQLENDDFFLLSFENVAVKGKGFGSKGKKSEMGSEDLKQRRVEVNKNKENRRETVLEKKNKKNKEEEGSKRKVYKEDGKKMKRITDKHCRKAGNGSSRIKDSGLSPPHNKEVHRKSIHVSRTVSPTKSKNKKEVTERALSPKKRQSRSLTKKIEPESDTENTSPVSVLDLGDFLIEPRTPISEEGVKPRGSNSRRKLSAELLKSDECPSQHLPRISISEDRKSRGTNRNDSESEKAICHTQDNVELWGGICKLAEENLVGSNWISKEMSKLEEFEEIGIEFGLQIVDQLVNEIIDELCRLPSRICSVMTEEIM
ncbi:uncharacterized protein LOC122067815 [Macadamia integrifolia]|uniref:uncharacterized protein LOC122067815 n=1 Tax=Macadamia integrifolia TaxID=60698 RepID=UPI001C4EE166|nr:uncharacterized protein LOC122067815 [Macadamia integrifolia]